MPSQVTTTSAATASTRGMGEGEPHHPPDQPDELDDHDHRLGGAVRPGTATPGPRTGRGCRPGRAARPPPSYGRAALDSPPLRLRQQGETPGAAGMPVPAAPPAVTIRRPHRPAARQAVPVPLSWLCWACSRSTSAANLRRLAGQFPGELHRRVAGLAVGDADTSPWSTRRRRPGSGCGRRRCSGTSTSPRRRAGRCARTIRRRSSCRHLPWSLAGTAAAGRPDAGCLERVGQPPGLVHVRRDRQPGELHRGERRPGRPGRDDRLDLGGDLDLDRPGPWPAGRGR